MANFWDLPKPLRDKIYRLHLVQEDPIGLSEFQAMCGIAQNERATMRAMPRLLQLCKKTEREAAAIFFGENTFILKLQYHHIWKARMWPRHMKLIRHMIVDGWDAPQNYGSGYNEQFKTLKSLTGLDTLTVKVDERISLESYLKRDSKIKWHSSLGCGTQLQLQVLNFCGMAGIRSLRFPHVDFPPMTEAGRDHHGDSGGIPGGILDTLVRHEIEAKPLKRIFNRKGQFRFLELPPECRNVVYSMLLTFPGVTYPTADKPTSVTSQFPALRGVDRDDIPVPHSALAILQTNRQVHNEAAGIFYQNDLVFSYPAHLQAFILSLESERLEAVSSLTLFYKDHNEGGVHTMGITLKLLRRMRGLKKFHLLVENHLARSASWTTAMIVASTPVQLHGVDVLFQLRGLTDIKVRDLGLEDRYNGLSFYKTNDPARKSVENKVQVLKHFNHGLELAQQGMVARALYQEAWWCYSKVWPAVGDAECGREKGCSCGRVEENDGGKESGSD